jgi:hypothetical protein
MEGEEPKHVTLTAAILCDNQAETKTFDLTLNPKIDTSLTDDIALVQIPVIMQGDLVLPHFPNGTAAEIISSDTSLLANDGTVTKPAGQSRLVRFSIRYTNNDKTLVKDYETVVAKEVPLLSMEGYYEDFNNIGALDDAGVYLNAGGESFGETGVVFDELLRDQVMSFKMTSSEGTYNPEIRFAQISGRVMIEFDTRIMTPTANFAYIYGSAGITSSLGVSNGTVNIRIRSGGGETSVNLLENIDPNRWYHFKMEIDCRPVSDKTGPAKTSVWVDGAPKLLNGTTRADATYVNRILIVPASVGGELRFDNYRVYTNYEDNVRQAAETLALAGIDAVMSDYAFPARTADGMNIGTTRSLRACFFAAGLYVPIS